MASSLDKLASNLDDDQCKNLRQFFDDEEQFRLMRRKGVYPYEYVDSWEKFEETELPPKEAFYSKLNMKGISVEDYEHAKKVWSSMKKKNLGEYHDVYLKTDVLLLARRVRDVSRDVPESLCVRSRTLLHGSWIIVESSIKTYWGGIGVAERHRHVAYV